MEKQIPDHFICPLTLSVMKDPHIDNEGISYEKDAIMEWLHKGKQVSPGSNKPLQAQDLRPNRALREAIEKFFEENPELMEGNSPREPEPMDQSETPVSAPRPGDIPDESASCHRDDTQNDGNLVLDAVTDGSHLMVSIVPPENASYMVPSQICCVVDVSGSMGTEAVIQDESGAAESHGLSVLDITKHALNTIAHSLSQHDTFSLVTFTDEARVVCKPMKMTDENKKKAEKMIKDLEPLNSTNLWTGLETGLNLMRGDFDALTNPAIFLLTDGMPNMSPGKGELHALQSYGRNNKGLPCQLHTFGFGYSMDSHLLDTLAVFGGGQYSFIPDGGFVGTVFVNAVSNHVINAANNLKLSLCMTDKAGKFQEKGDFREYQLDELSKKDNPIVTLGTIQLGQTKNIVFPVEIKKPCQIQASLVYYRRNQRKEANLTVSVQPSDCSDYQRASIKYHLGRMRLVGGVNQAVAVIKGKNAQSHDQVKEMKKGTAAIEQLVKELRKVLPDEARASDLLLDLTGQISEGFSKEEFYRKWGYHYSLSIKGAHLMQVCNNFKDPGVQHYSSEIFESTRDRLDSVFLTLPAPKPSIKKYDQGGKVRNASPVNMTRFMNLRGGCVHPESLVATSAGVKLASDVIAGDEVMTPDGHVDRVECVLKTHTAGEEPLEMVNIQGLLITPWHPIRLHDSWVFPAEVGSQVALHTEAVYTFLLENRNNMMMNGVEVATLAHGLRGEVISHAFLGTERIAENLKCLEGYSDGLVEVESEGFVRDEQLGEIIGLVQFE